MSGDSSGIGAIFFFQIVETVETRRPGKHVHSAKGKLRQRPERQQVGAKIQSQVHCVLRDRVSGHLKLSSVVTFNFRTQRNEPTIGRRISTCTKPWTGELCLSRSARKRRAAGSVDEIYANETITIELEPIFAIPRGNVIFL
jgi:hypothetical protein